MLAAWFALAAGFAAPAAAWDSGTHRLITRLAIAGLPPSPLSTLLRANERRLERLSVEPDTKFKRLYGDDERRRHYIDLENYGWPSRSKLEPDFRRALATYGAETVARSGTLPWTIDGEAAQLAAAARSGECGRFLSLAGHLSHYVGDATQPLHTTRNFDGAPADRGVHARFEGAVDEEAGAIGRAARGAVAVRELDSVWSAVMDEIRHSYLLVQTVLDADRRTRRRAASPSARGDLAAVVEPLAARQVARAASLLASIWFYEWRRVGSRPPCAAPGPGG